MSSIAYISDDKMIEYHRANGNAAINFWRLSTKKFERFDIGSLLFFIDKRHMYPHSKEKGIIGYGRVRNIRNMSIKRTWNEYQTMNGFNTYDQFTEAIRNVTKTEHLPKQIQSLELDHVVFFKGPLYLSEVDFTLPPRLESFIYLIKGEQDVAINLLEKALSIGIDPWFRMMHEVSRKSLIHEDIQEQHLRNILAEVYVEWTQLQENLTFSVKNSTRVGPLAYQYEQGKTSIYLPCSSLKNQYYELLGIKTWLEKKLKSDAIEFYIVMKKQDAPSHNLNDLSLKLLYI